MTNMRTPTVHHLKCWVSSYDAIARGEKTAEVRSEIDRTFNVGDELVMHRGVPQDTAGRWEPWPLPHGDRLRLVVTHISRQAGPLDLFGLLPSKANGLVRLAVLSFVVGTPATCDGSCGADK
jgi:hypothetical protein